MDVLGHWELNLILKKYGAWKEGRHAMVDFLPFFIFFARLVAIKDGLNRKNCIFYLFKQF